MSFRKLTTDCLKTVRGLLQKHLPHSCQILNIVDLQLQGRYLKDSYHSSIYGIPGTDVLNAIWIPSKLLSSKAPHVSVLYLPPDGKAPIKIPDILRSYQTLHNWTKVINFEGTPEPFVRHLEEMIKDKNGSSQKSKIKLFYLPEERTKTLNPQVWIDKNAGKFEVQNLRMEHAEKMNEFWKYGYQGAKQYLREILQVYECGKGIFRKGQVNNEGLVCWSTLLNLGTSGCLFTLRDARGHGLAHWSFEETLRCSAVDRGLIPAAEVEVDNIGSLALMDKVGMKLANETFFVKYVPSSLRL